MIIMPTKSTFNHYNLTGHNASKKTTNVSQFFGVEYLNSQLETKDYHATDIKNIVYKDKTNQKRSGYEQVAKTPNVEGINIRRNAVNGYFEFLDIYDEIHKVIHIGSRLYEVSFLEKGSHYWETKFNLISNNMANHKSMAFSSKGILYILDGTKYRYLSLNTTNDELELNNVVGSDIVYIPTTSLLNSDGTITAYDDVNILTNLRKNRIVGFKKEDIYQPIIIKIIEGSAEFENINPFDVELYFSQTLNGTRQRVQYLQDNVTITAKNSARGGVVLNNYVWFKYTNNDGDVFWSKAVQVKEEDNANQNEFVLDSDLSWTISEKDYFISKTCLNVNGIEYTPIIGSANVYNFVVGGSKIARLYYKSDSLILKLYNDDLFDSVENDITITFPSSSTVENVDTINNCTFGIIYNDRLFISGNPNNKNTDWHTQPITNYGNDETYGDFTYFSDLDYCNYGSDNTSVVGYDIFSDGNLIVFKEPSRFEPTIYRRYKELKVATSYTGEVVENQGTELYEEGYPCFPINTMGGEGAIKNRSITNFLGNTLVLTKSGIKKLYTRQNTYNNERILVDVSSNINLAITKEDLSNAFLFTFKDRLILQIGDITYVAYDSLKEDNEYEWYKLEGIKADIFFEIDNELYFSDINGNICRFNDGEYVFKDRDRYYLPTGSALPNANNIVVNTELDEDDYALPIEHFSNGTERPMYYVVGKITSPLSYSDTYDGVSAVEDGKTHIYLRKINDILADGLKVNLIYNGSLDSTEYVLEQTNDTAIYNEFYIKDTNGNYFNSTTIFTILVSTMNKQLSIKKVENEDNEYELVDGQGNSVEFYTTNAESYYLIITHDKNVEAYYKTKPYDMGSIGYDKTIWQYTIANDTNLESVIDLGYLANRKQGITGFAKGSKGLDFEAYNFSEISFLNDGLPHIYTKYRMIPNVNFIRFEFRNLFDSNMVLSQLSFVYTISGQVRGSK